MTDLVLHQSALAQVCHHSAEAIIIIDPTMKIYLFNPAAEAAFEVEASDVLGQRIDEHPVLQTLAPMIEQLAVNNSVREDLEFPSGESGWVQLLIAPENNRPLAQLDEINNINSTKELVHDLKVPLSAAKGFIDLVIAIGELNDKQQSFIQRTQISLAFMLTQVNEILDMALVESSAVFNPIQTDLNDVVKHALIHLHDYAQLCGSEIILELSPDGCPLQGDEKWLGSAIRNLVSNAIKYSPNGGKITISVRSKKNNITLSVTDQGLGIEKKHFSRIFDRFYRIKTPDTQRIEGSGLGLSIVKTAIDQHGGQVSVKSVPGKGSTFSFSLPA